MKKVSVMFLVLVILVSVLTSCSKSPASSNDSKGKLKDVNVILDWYPNSLHEFLYYAKEKGYFEEEGLNVNFTVPANSTDPITMVASGKAQIGMYYVKDTIIGLSEEDLPIVSIGAVMQKQPAVFMTSTDTYNKYNGDISGLLKEGKIGSSGTASDEANLKALCQKYNLDYDSLDIVNVGFDLITALKSGTVDVTTTGFMNVDVQELIESGFDTSYWTYGELGLTDEYGEVFLANKDSVSEDSDLYAAFLRACLKGFHDMSSDQKASTDFILTQMDSANYPLNKEVETKAWSILMDIMPTSDKQFLIMNEKPWEDAQNFLYDYGCITKKVDLSKVLVTDLLDDYHY